MSKLRAGASALLGAVLISGILCAPAQADIVMNGRVWSYICDGGISASDVREFRYLAQQDPWLRRRYGGWPDSALRAVLKSGCSAWGRYRSVEAANRAAFG